MKLRQKKVAKPWGKAVLPEIFGGAQKRKIGEIWFQPPKNITLDLMIKYLFTSEKLSIQVHPSERIARRQGYRTGKEECWYILSTEPDAVLGLGLTKEVSPAKLRAAVACDQIEALVDWKPAKPGDFFYVPAGTVHAIGADITLVEIQQNLDLTYRLFDYGRGRNLHLDEAIEAADTRPYDMTNFCEVPLDESAILIDGPHFRVFQLVGNDPDIITMVKASEWQIIPLEGEIVARSKKIAAGQCGVATKASDIDLSNNIRALIACNMR